MSAAANERTTIQQALLDAAIKHGARYIEGRELTTNPGRDLSEGLLPSELTAAVIRLNPGLSPSDIERVVANVRAKTRGISGFGELLAANQAISEWLRDGMELSVLAGAKKVSRRVRLLDREEPLTGNSWIVSDEVPVRGLRPDGSESAEFSGRFDVVLWCNGLPFIVGETKSPFADSSWFNAACELTGQNDGSSHPVTTGYVPGAPSFFAGNLLLVATEGRALHYGALGQPAEEWLAWRSAEDGPLEPFADCLRSAELLMNPVLLTEMAGFYVRFSALGSGRHLTKILPRPAQVEAVRAVIGALKSEPDRRSALLRLYQGSGKTLLIGFIAARLLAERSMNAPTILAVVDRVDLNAQTYRELESISLLPIRVAKSRADLKRLLTDSAAGGSEHRGFILVNVQLFESAEPLTNRDNVIVLADEAHRSQEGWFGSNLRSSLPNARIIGLTGTTIRTGGRDTYANFADPKDKGGLLYDYSILAANRDGVTVPIVVERRRIDYDVDHELDAKFDTLASEAGLEDRVRAKVKRLVARREQLLKHPDRVRVFAADVVEHFLGAVRPNGMKAMVVVESRELCVAVNAALNELLPKGLEATVVMTTKFSGKRADPESWRPLERSGEEEQAVLKRFADPADGLVLLVVTDKLLTGFSSRVAGAMYLDKVIRDHTLAQAAARVNRRWTGDAGAEKRVGLIVDYVGCGDELDQAMAEQTVGAKGILVRQAVDLGQIMTRFAERLRTSLNRFSGIDRTDPQAMLLDAESRVPAGEEREAFLREAAELDAYWSLIEASPKARQYRADVRFLRQIALQFTPSDVADRIAIARVGERVRQLVTDSLSDFSYDPAIDAVPLPIDDERIRELAEKIGVEATKTLTRQTVEERLRARLARLFGGGTDHVTEISLVSLLERLKQLELFRADQVNEFVEGALDLGRQIAIAEREAAERSARGQGAEVSATGNSAALKPRDPRVELVRVLEDILEERRASGATDDSPTIIRRVFAGIDEICREYAFEGWKDPERRATGERMVKNALRKLLTESAFPADSHLFERAYEFIRENY